MKSKNLTIVFIILGIIGIITLSIFLISISNFIYYLFIEIFDIQSHFYNDTLKELSKSEIKEAYNLLVNYSIHGGPFNGLGVLKYTEKGISHLEDVKQVYFGIKIIMILSIGFFIMLKVLFDKGTLYSYVEFKNHTPYFYIGWLSIIISFTFLFLGIINFEWLFDVFHEVVFKDNYVMSPKENEFVSILPIEYFLLMLILILLVIIILSIVFIIKDKNIRRKEEKMSVKLIAIDLDGTLLNDKKEISLRTLDALKKASKKGVYVVLASGRPIKGMINLIKTLELDNSVNYAISFNGAAINRNDTLEAIYNCSLKIDEVLKIEEFAKNNNVHSHAFINGECVLEEEGEYSNLESTINKLDLIYKKYSEFSQSDVVNKYMFADEPQKLKEIYPLLPKELFAKYTIVFSAPFFLEFLNKETNKGKALKYLCEYLNISPNEVMAIGDEENDLSMLEYAGYKIAMGNANPKLKEIATYITNSNNDDGVGKVVEMFVLNKL